MFYYLSQHNAHFEDGCMYCYDCLKPTPQLKSYISLTVNNSKNSSDESCDFYKGTILVFESHRKACFGDGGIPFKAVYLKVSLRLNRRDILMGRNNYLREELNNSVEVADMLLWHYRKAYSSGSLNNQISEKFSLRSPFLAP